MPGVVLTFNLDEVNRLAPFLCRFSGDGMLSSIQFPERQLINDLGFHILDPNVVIRCFLHPG